MRLRAFSLLVILVAGPVLAATAGEEEGARLAAELGCAACHAGLGVEDATRGLAPDLSFAGLRYQPGYLFDYLRRPRQVRRHIGAARMPDFGLSEPEALALTLFLAAQRAGPAAAALPRDLAGLAAPARAPDGEMHDLGAELREHACLGCHSWDGAGGVLGPELSDFGARLQPDWVRRFLVAPEMFGVPDGVMPALFVRAGDDGVPHETSPGALRALEHIVSAGAARSHARSEAYAATLDAARARHPTIGAADGERVLRSLACTACHRLDGIASRSDDAPDLGNEGIRVRAAWLRSYLASPTTIRPAGGAPGSASRMPDFRLTPDEADALVAFLMQRRQGGELLRRDFAPAPLGAHAMRKARAVLRDELACLGCHRLGGEGGSIGPDLSSVTTRLEPAFVEAMVREPQQLAPHAMMPRLPMPERTRDLVVRYLVQQTEPPAPAARLSPLEAILPVADAASPAAALYLRSCAPCHGSDGRGDGFNARFLPVKPTAHADAAVLAQRADDTLYDGIAAGGAILARSHRMPAWGETLSSAQIRDLVRHLRELCRCEGPAWSLRAAGEGAAASPAPDAAPHHAATVARAPARHAAPAAGTYRAAPQDEPKPPQVASLEQQPDAAPASGASPAGEIVFPPPLPRAQPTTFYRDFLGAEACRPCHAEQYELWAASTHGHAGGLPGDAELIARFDGKPLRFKDARVLPEKGADGRLSFTIEHGRGEVEKIDVAAVVGGGHMIGGGTQSFFARDRDGTLRFLPFDFIRAEDVWFAQLRKDGTWAPIDGSTSLAELANWPPLRILGNAPAVSNCDVCHGSQIQVLPGANDTVQTRFKSLDINCESCHGPGRRHVEWAMRPDRDAAPDAFMASLDLDAKDASLRVCFQCHASRPVLDPDYLPGRSYDDHFALKYWLLEDNPYFPDGRIRTFSYQDNHQFSDCYVNGAMTCVDCHDPHSQKYRDAFGRKLEGRFDDGQCTACHASKAVRAEEHTHHRVGSPGAACTSCHMPFLQEPAVGDKLRFARSDHTIPIPRPAFDAALGIVNACSQCHADRTVDALQAQTERWWGPIKPHPAVVDATIAAEHVSQTDRAAALLLRPGDRHVIGQFAALATFARRFLNADQAPDGAVLALLEELAASTDVDVSSLALASVHFSAGQDARVRRLLAEALTAAGRRDRALRLRWASALATIAGARAQAGDSTAPAAARAKIAEILPFGSQDRLWSSARGVK